MPPRTPSLPRWPHDSWPGIATGGDLLILDLDKKHGGLEEVSKLDLPDTFTVRTASGGRHLYFKVPPGRRFQSRACRVGKDGRKHYAIRDVWGVDVRAEGGLVVGPGGEFAGKPYTIEKDIAIAALPESAMARLELAPQLMDGGGRIADGVQLDAPWAVARAEHYLKTEADLAIEGSGGDCTTIATANRIFDFGLSEDKACELMLTHWNPRCRPPWDEHDLDYKIGSALRSRRDPVGRDQHTRHFQDIGPLTGAEQKPASWRDHVFTGADLQHAVFPPMRWVLPPILPEGLTFAAGKPKLGKSWLGLDLAIAVATGGVCLGAQLEEGDVLYLALEDNKRRMQRRMRALKIRNWPKRMTIATTWRKLNDGGVDDIRDWAKGVSAPRFVVVDTYAAAKSAKKTKGFDEDYSSLADLQKLAGELGLPILVFHHLRKQGADDPFDEISGTLGLTAAPDTLWALRRDKGNVVLHCRGREAEETSLAISFDAGTKRWKLLGDAEEVQRSEERKKVLRELQDLDGLPARIPVLAQLTGMSEANLAVLLSKMVDAGEVIRPSRGQYAIAKTPDRA